MGAWGAAVCGWAGDLCSGSAAQGRAGCTGGAGLGWSWLPVGVGPSGLRLKLRVARPDATPGPGLPRPGDWAGGIVSTTLVEGGAELAHRGSPGPGDGNIFFDKWDICGGEISNKRKNKHRWKESLPPSCARDCKASLCKGLQMVSEEIQNSFSRIKCVSPWR